MFCKHNWEILSEEITKSKFDNAIEALKFGGQSEGKLPWQVVCAERKFIQIVTCNKCGKLKRFVEVI